MTTNRNGTAAGFRALALLSLTVMASEVAAHAGDLQVTLDKKKAETVQKSTVGLVDSSKSKEVWHYLVNVRNTGLKPMPALEARYVIFIERQKLGEKKGNEVVDKTKGTAKLGVIEAGKTVSFETTDIKLHEEGLVGNYYYSNGGKIHAKDNIKGVWIKFFDGTKEVDQYMNPTTIASKQKWE